MYLKDLSVFASASTEAMFNFNKQTHCMEDMYLRNLVPFKNKRVSKLNIVLVEYEPNQLMKFKDDIGRVYNAMGVAEIYTDFDFATYFKQEIYEKKLKILQTIHDAFIKLASSEKWETSIFEKIYSKCVASELINKFWYKENIFSRNGEYKVSILIHLDINVLQVMAIFKNKQSKIVSEKFIFSREPEVFYEHYLSKVEWVSDSEISISDKSNGQQWKISIN